MIQALAEVIRMFGELVSYIVLSGVGLFLLAMSLVIFKDYQGRKDG
mgnify:CR=1 FL=1|tara:strand:- start:255 stop:392 length:138 start_codon:yes stop_codon:yes gene_type:complete